MMIVCRRLFCVNEVYLSRTLNKMCCDSFVLYSGSKFAALVLAHVSMFVDFCFF